jgi:hypothetical protein
MGVLFERRSRDQARAGMNISFFRVRLDGCSSINLPATRNTVQYIRINGKSRMPLSTFYRFRGVDFVTRDRNLTVQLHVRLERLPRFEAGEFCVYREREFTWFYMVNISAPSSLMVPPHAPGKKKSVHSSPLPVLSTPIHARLETPSSLHNARVDLRKMIHHLVLPRKRASLPGLAPRTSLHGAPELWPAPSNRVFAFVMALEFCQPPEGLVEARRCVAFVLVLAGLVGVEDDADGSGTCVLRVRGALFGYSM